MRRKSRYHRHLYNAYDLDLKKSVVEFAEQNGNKEAHAQYGISEANIRRWRRLKHDIFGKPPEYVPTCFRSRRRASNISAPMLNIRDTLEQDSQSSVDSMPLQERLSKVAAQEKIAASSGSSGQQTLKSQPLSPTKLKVTRQTPKVVKPPEPSESAESANEEMCLRWNSHHSNMQTAFPSILSKEQYVDVTLAAEGKTLKCHRLILSSCSPYFEEVLSGISPFQHPVLFMKDIPFWILKSLCDFMYAGEVHIFQNKLEELLTVAEALKIKGLAGKSTTPSDKKEESKVKSDVSNSGQPPNREVKKKPTEKAPPPAYVKKNPNYTQSNNFDSASQDYEEDLLDPLELLEPLYEEAAEEKKAASTGVKPKEIKYQYQPVKKPFARRLRKRKYSEQREPSPPPVFSFRKGTRSRPNVKIPKYYHSDFTNPAKSASNSQTDPLLDVEEIKTEPIDVEDNLINYSDEDNTIMTEHSQNSRCPKDDAPIVITNAKPLPPRQDKFKKIKLSKPIITEVHTIEENSPDGSGLEVLEVPMKQTQIVNEDKNKEAVVITTAPEPAEAESTLINNKGTEETELTVEHKDEAANPQATVETSETVEENESCSIEIELEPQETEGTVVTTETNQTNESVESVSVDMTEEEDSANIKAIDDSVHYNKNEDEGSTVTIDRSNDSVNIVTEKHNSGDVDRSREDDSVDVKTTEVVDSTNLNRIGEQFDSVNLYRMEEDTDALVNMNSTEQADIDLADINKIKEVGCDNINRTEVDSTNINTTEEVESTDVNSAVFELEDVAMSNLEDADSQDFEQSKMQALNRLEKEAMNVVDVINMEAQAGPPDIE